MNVFFGEWPAALPRTAGALPPEPAKSAFALLREGQAWIHTAGGGGGGGSSGSSSNSSGSAATAAAGLLVVVQRETDCDMPVSVVHECCMSVCVLLNTRPRPTSSIPHCCPPHPPFLHNTPCPPFRPRRPSHRPQPELPVHTYPVPNFYGFRGEPPGAEAWRRADYGGYAAGLRCLRVAVRAGVPLPAAPSAAAGPGAGEGPGECDESGGLGLLLTEKCRNVARGADVVKA
mgnify:CR=1 FL=1